MKLKIVLLSLNLYFVISRGTTVTGNFPSYGEYASVPFNEIGDGCKTGTTFPSISSTFPSKEQCARVPTVNKIIRGVQTDIDEFPFTALIEAIPSQYYQYLQYYNNINYKVEPSIFCGGSLINNRYVLTAAHCVTDAEWKPINIRLGEWDLTTNRDCMGGKCSDPPKTVAIEKTMVHEQYNKATIENDIALVKVKENVEFTDFIRPLCLPWTPEELEKTYRGAELEVVGFGKTETSLQSTRKLKANLKEIDCSIVNRYIRAVYTHKHICAGGMFGENSCSGDSGGSLVANEGDVYLAVGIVSFSTEDCSVPGAYARVSKYMQWIRSKVES